MELLSSDPRTIAPISKMVWLSDDLRDKWSKRLSFGSKLTNDLELMSLKHDLRKCAIRNIRTRDFSEVSSDLKKKYGVIAMPLSVVKMPNVIFAHYHQPSSLNDPDSLLHCVLSKDPYYLFEYQKAYKESDHIKMGSLLGYPSCCCKFFQELYPKGYIDPVWHAALRSEHSKHDLSDGYLVKVNKWFIFSNPIARYLGLRFSFHITCSFSCHDSIVFGMKLKDLARSMGKDTSWYEEVCYSSYWDCYKGVAVIGFPAIGLFLCSSSNMSKHRHVVYLDDGMVNSDFFHEMRSRSMITNEPKVCVER